MDLFVSTRLISDNFRYTNPRRLAELKCIFPARDYADDLKKMNEFKEANKNIADMVDQERTLYVLLTSIPRIREKICAILFCKEGSEKFEEALENAEHVKKALEELDSKRIKKLLEIVLVVGNYVNNPTTQVKGCSVESLLKLNDVVSKNKQKYTLMHHIARIVQDHFKDVLLFPDDLDNVPAAGTAFESLTAEFGDMRKGVMDIKIEMDLCKEEGNTKYYDFIKPKYDEFSAELKKITEIKSHFEERAQYFGEKNAADLGTFFLNWDKFKQSFQNAVRYNITLERKEKALAAKEAAMEKRNALLKKKEEKQRRKEKKLLLLKKKKKMLRRKKKLEKQKPGTKPTSGSSNGTSGAKKSARKKSKGDDSEVTNVALDDFLTNVLSNVDEEEQGGRIEKKERAPRKGPSQLMLSLRTSKRINSMRNQRVDRDETVSLESQKRLVKQVSSRMPKFLPS
eukprot:TRINITY_DN2542_c0_g1_i1.p2 TRINITY_DN2542_c0_g1~~TRINITY_DN2542_c0_g1_i1.p2  ORF type:complete len:455 (+),score=115.97 TRINITY_DN2542_c0_g1_i1:1242-2606(+)